MKKEYLNNLTLLMQKKKAEWGKALRPLQQMKRSELRVGLDIGAATVKVVVMGEDSGQRLVAKKFACREIVRTGDDKMLKSDEALLKETIISLWQELRIKDRAVRLVISDPAVYSRQISVPKVSEQELIRSIRWQAEKYATFPVENAIVDFQWIKEGHQSSSNQADIVLVAVQREVVNRYIDILKSARVFPKIIDFAPFATAKAVGKLFPVEKDEVLPVLDVGFRATTLSIVSNESLYLTRAIEIGQAQLTRMIADARHIDRAEAEKIKRSTSVMELCRREAAQEKMSTSLEEGLQDLASKIERCLIYCERDLLGEKMKRIILCGGGARHPGLAEYLGQKLGLPVEAANPLPYLRGVKGVLEEERIREILPQCMAALGAVI